MAERLCVWLLSGISIFLLKAALAGHLARNVALKSPAFQSSFPTAAAAAVDGNRDPAQASTCTVTQSESGPWWMVDLQKEYKVDAVAITSSDSSQATLDGVEVWLGISQQLSDSRRTRCAAVSSFPPKRTLLVPCGGLGGRYVTVLLPADGRALGLCEVEVYPVQVEYPLPNVALKGAASQSSTHHFPNAYKAIDGRRNSFHLNGSCSHNTMEDSDPWWQVDLHRTFIVTSIKVTNRGDCCAERLDGATITVGHMPENNGTSNPRCASISHIKAGKTATFHCEGGSMAGRFVTIIIPGTRKTLVLCEVEVYGVPEETPLQNVAWNKNVQLPTQSGYSPASDCSDRASLVALGSMIPNLWWKIDLSAVYKVRAVTIIHPHSTFKETNVYIKQLDNDWDDNLCVKASPLQETRTHTFYCGDMVGRYVQFLFPSVVMSMCEVEVYASPAESPQAPGPTPPPVALPSESMLLNGRTVTLVGERLCWSDALLYCRRNNSDLLSLHSEEEQKLVAQMLGRAPFTSTGGVWLGLRRYIMGEIWFWMSGDTMNFSHWYHNSIPGHYSSPCGSMDVGEDHWWAARSCSEHLNFICQSGGAHKPERVSFDSYSTTGTG